MQAFALLSSDSRRRWSALLLPASLAGLGCAGAGQSDAVLVRDSAGVRIVRYAGERAWTADDVLRVSTAPLVSIGSAGDAPGAQLYRVTDVHRLSDGRIVVANAGTGELRYFDSRGEFLFAAGGAGGGPGEFATGVWSDGLSVLGGAGGDTLLAYDRTNRRVSVFGPEGGYVRSSTLMPPGEGLSHRIDAVGWLCDGTLVGYTGRLPGERSIAPGDEIRRFTHALVFYGPDGTLMHATGRFPGDEAYISIGPMDASGTFSVAATEVPFLKKLFVAAGCDRIAVGWTDAYEIRLYGPGAALRQVIRRAGEPPPVTRKAVEAWMDERLSDIEDPGRRRERRRELEKLPYPERMPAFASLAIDARGWLWVEEYAAPGTPGPARWTVFDRRGRRVGGVEMPRGLAVHEIGENYVLGIRKDDLGVEYVQLHRLEAPGANGR